MIIVSPISQEVSYNYADYVEFHDGTGFHIVIIGSCDPKGVMKSMIILYLFDGLIILNCCHSGV